MIATPSATETVTPPPTALPPPRPGFLRALGHCSARALLVGAACAAIVVIPLRLIMAPSAVVARLRLTQPPAKDGPADLAPPRRELAALVKDASTLVAVLDEPAVAGSSLIRKRKAPAQWLGAALAVRATPGGDTVEVSLRAEPGSEAVSVVNAVAERAAAEFSARQRHAATARLDAIETDPRAARVRLESLKGRLREVAAAVGAVNAANLSQRQRLTLERLAEAEKELRQTRARLVADPTQTEARLTAEVQRLEAENRALLAAAAEADRLSREAVATEVELRAAEAEARALAAAEAPLAEAIVERCAEAPAMETGRNAASALAAIVAVAVVLTGYGWREWQARRVYSARDVTRMTGLRLFGTLPAAAEAMRRRLAGAGPPARERRRLTEAADAARTRLLHEMGPRGMRLLMVTGADGAEGKTSLAVLLAVSLARAWRRTLLIDANLRRPTAHRVFGLNTEPGLAELLRGEAAVEQVIQATQVSRLWVLPAGRADDHALQALAQDDVGPLLADLGRRFDFVVIDTASVLLVADTLMLARHVDAALLAVLRGVSRMPPLEAARTSLEAVGARLLGAVVLGASAP